MFLYLLLSIFYLSLACAIEDLDENNLIITGGGYDGGPTNRVTKYNRNGEATDLPTLNIPRYNHGCGSYRNTNEQKVSKTYDGSLFNIVKIIMH